MGSSWFWRSCSMPEFVREDSCLVANTSAVAGGRRGAGGRPGATLRRFCFCLYVASRGRRLSAVLYVVVALVGLVCVMVFCILLCARVFLYRLRRVEVSWEDGSIVARRLNTSITRWVIYLHGHYTRRRLKCQSSSLHGHLDGDVSVRTSTSTASSAFSSPSSPR